jgi:serine/threonine-protein kinase
VRQGADAQTFQGTGHDRTLALRERKETTPDRDAVDTAQEVMTMSDEMTGPYLGPTPPPSAARFAPGELLAGRYRVVAPLGRGGMGEVYRVDDLALGQPVALKFLPPHLASEPDRLARFRKEVATARAVSHPNVCRVYDLGDHAGQLFLAMEYIDGEDLASLLRRVGRLPEEKGVDIARQLCLALAAVHEQGLLHRDLKPHNVMLDGRGKVRLTDFGLAATAGDISEAEVRSGTPAYQAPEQLRGEAVSVQSDLFALGLVLYEVFTGKRAFPAATREELARAYESGPPDKPSSRVAGLNPAVERAVLRCLERQPKERPRSAYEVLAGLPGGDPLAAVLAAGETPSPQMVADAPVEGRLSPAVGLALLAAVVGGIVLMAILADRIMLFRQVPLNRRPEVVAQQAQDLLESLCHTDAPADRAWHYRYDAGYLRHVRDTDPSPGRWDGLKTQQPTAVIFFYRQSPWPLLAHTQGDDLSAVSALDPPPVVPGMAGVELDGQGRLLSLYVIPPEHDTTKPGPPPDWARLFTAAGLDVSQFRPADPEWTSLVDADLRVAWTGTYPGRTDLPLRVEAGAWRGKPVFFKMIAEAWAKPERGPASSPLPFWFYPVVTALMVGGSLLAARNLWLRRGDRRGAFCFALAFVLIQTLGWALEGGLSFSPDGLSAFGVFVGHESFFAAIIAMWYLALEPTVRRRWPWRLVASGRLLDCRLRDPLVGRDLLVGLAAGTLIALLPRLLSIAAGWFGPPPIPLTIPVAPQMASRFGPPVDWGVIIRFAGYSISGAMFTFMVAFLLHLILRKQWLSWGGYVLVVTAQYSGIEPSPERVTWALVAALILAVVVGRFGLLATVSALFTSIVLSLAPLTTDLSAWYARQGVAAALVVIGLAAYGFVVSVGAKRLALRGLFGEE